MAAPDCCAQRAAADAKKTAEMDLWSPGRPRSSESVQKHGAGGYDQRGPSESFGAHSRPPRKVLPMIPTSGVSAAPPCRPAFARPRAARAPRVFPALARPRLHSHGAARCSISPALRATSCVRRAAKTWRHPSRAPPRPARPRPASGVVLAHTRAVPSCAQAGAELLRSRRAGPRRLERMQARCRPSPALLPSRVCLAST